MRKLVPLALLLGVAAVAQEPEVRWGQVASGLSSSDTAGSAEVAAGEMPAASTRAMMVKAGLLERILSPLLLLNLRWRIPVNGGHRR